jgi:hypothetical protein
VECLTCVWSVFRGWLYVQPYTVHMLPGLVHADDAFSFAIDCTHTSSVGEVPCIVYLYHHPLC